MTEDSFEILKQLVSEIDALRKTQKDNEGLDTTMALYPLISSLDFNNLSENTKMKLEEVSLAAAAAVNNILEEEILIKMNSIQQLKK